MKKILHWLDENLEEFILVIFLIAMTLIMGIQVLCRYVLGMSLSWSEELTRYLFIWCGFLSVSYCSKKCLSIKIEQFVAIFPRRGKALFKVVNHTFELIFFIYMIPFAWSYMMSSVHSGQLSPACGIPMYYIQAAPFVSFILVAFRVLLRWIIEFRVAKGENVYLRGFGSFIVKKRAQKTARNISKNTTIIIPAHNIPAFKPAKTFMGEVK